MNITKEKLNVLAALLRREKETHGLAKATDEEVITAVEVFHDLIDIGNILGLEMLSSWAVNHFTVYNGIAWHREISNRIKK